MSKIKTLPSADCAKKNATRHGRSRFAPTALAIALSSALAMPSVAMADNWNGAIDADWFTSGNWSAGVPAAGTVVVIDAAPFNPTIQGNATFNGFAGSLSVGDSSNAILQVQNGATLTLNADLTVGNSATGKVSILNGSVITNATGLIGNNATGNGTVNVDGTGSKWDNTQDVQVGSSGTGVLNITAGGLVKSAGGSLGGGVGSQGTVNVDGMGSSWDSSGPILVGGVGTGAGFVSVLNGGAVKSGAVAMANGSKANGTMTVSGSDANGVASSWTINGDLTVGSAGTAIVNIQNGGVITNATGLIGNNATGNGTVNVDGTGSKWDNTQDVQVGSSGTGVLNITAGGLVKSAGGSLGGGVGSQGTVNVDGMGSSWDSSGPILVGGVGTGAGFVSVLNGGAVKSGAVAMANGSKANGTMTVSGSDANGVASSWTINGDLTVGSAGTAIVNIQNGGVITNATGLIGNNATGNGTVNVDGNTSKWTNTGDLTIGNAGTGVLNITNNGYVQADGNITLGAAATGFGTVNIGLNAKLYAASGSLLVNRGLLFVDAGGAVDAVMGLTLNAAGTLAGNGLVNTNVLLAQPGATIAPGNRGTLTIAGNLTQTAGSIYAVSLDATGQTDLVQTSGTTDIQSGAILKPTVVGGGGLKVGTHYTVLTAAGGVTGTYTLANTAFLGFAASYDANNVYLDVTKSASFGTIGLTRNQIATGNATDTLGSGQAVYDAILNSATTADARAALDQLSGEVHASARGVLMQDSHFMRDASLERLRVLDSESVANDGGADPQEGKQARLLPSVRDLAYWARTMGSWGHIEGDGNAATVKRDTAGFLMGADTRFGEEGRFGLMGGYSRSAFDVTDRNSSGSSDNYHLGAYAGSRWGDLALRTGLSYSWHDVSTSRNVAFPGFTDSLKADYKASTTQAFAELGYRIKTDRAEFEPFANLAHVNVSSDGFTERGGAAALTSGGASNGVTFGTLGIRASTKVGLANGSDVTARGSLGWRTASGDTTPATTLAFAGGSQFAIAGAPIAKNAAIVEAGLDFRLTPATTLGLYWAGQFGSGVKDQSARINLNVAF